MMGFVRFIPNLITMFNLTAGTIATILAIEGNLPGAGVAICIAALFDFLDGFAARVLKAYSAIGKELDSLADVVSFGVAPAMIMFTLMKTALFGTRVPFSQLNAPPLQWLILLSAFIIPAFSAYRLAKFNTDTRQNFNFLGLPTPANALLWASFGLMHGISGKQELMILLFTPKNLVITAVITSVLLVSELPMFSLKARSFHFYDNWYRYLFLTVSVILLLFTGLFSLTLIILIYIVLSLLLYVLKVTF